eukprot:Gb_35725 [translate_table: standard]
MGEQSSANQCSICLEPITGEAYLDQCFHKFCYHCILQWAEMVSGQQPNSFPHMHCPLCKVQNKSIIHNFVGPTFQRHYISKVLEKSFVMSEAHIRRLQTYFEPPDVRCNDMDSLEHWKRHGNLPSNRWMQCWIKRDLQALMQEEDVDIIMHHVLGVLEPFQRRTGQKYSTSALALWRAQCKSLVSDALRPFVFEKSSRFADELELFLISGLDIAAYDEHNLKRSVTGYMLGCSDKEMPDRDESVLSVSPENVLAINADKHEEKAQSQGFDLLDEHVDGVAELNIGPETNESIRNICAIDVTTGLPVYLAEDASVSRNALVKDIPESTHRESTAYDGSVSDGGDRNERGLGNSVGNYTNNERGLGRSRNQSKHGKSEIRKKQIEGQSLDARYVDTKRRQIQHSDKSLDFQGDHGSGRIESETYFKCEEREDDSSSHNGDRERAGSQDLCDGARNERGYRNNVRISLPDKEICSRSCRERRKMTPRTMKLKKVQSLNCRHKHMDGGREQYPDKSVIKETDHSNEHFGSGSHPEWIDRQDGCTCGSRHRKRTRSEYSDSRGRNERGYRNKVGISHANNERDLRSSRKRSGHKLTETRNKQSSGYETTKRREHSNKSLDTEINQNTDSNEIKRCCKWIEREDGSTDGTRDEDRGGKSNRCGGDLDGGDTDE